MTVPAVLAASVALGPSVIIGGPMVSAQVLQNSLENLRSMKAEAAKMGKVDDLQKQKELEEWDHIEVKRDSSTTIRTVKSDAPKGKFFHMEKIEGVPTVDQPLVHVHHKDSIPDKQRHRMRVAKELKEDGEAGFVVLWRMSSVLPSYPYDLEIARNSRSEGVTAEASKLLRRGIES